MSAPTVDLHYGVDVLGGLAALPERSVHCAIAKATGRSAIGIDLNAAYLSLAEDRIASVTAPMVPAGYEDAAPAPTNGNGADEHTQQELFA